MSTVPNSWKCLEVLGLTGGNVDSFVIIHGTKSKTASQLRGNLQCAVWKGRRTKMLHVTHII